VWTSLDLFRLGRGCGEVEFYSSRLAERRQHMEDHVPGDQR
jgi:hypothetical protein